MCAIFKREFKNFFQNVIGWVFIAAMIFIASLYFRAYNIIGAQPDIRLVLVNLLMIMIFAIPVLSMRILTEDKKNKVDQLTLTSPASIGKIVAGKYLSMLAVLGITTVAIGAFLLLIAKYTTIDWGINGVALFGFLLYGGACIAICLFVSSFTESQVIAAIVSIVSMFIVYLMSGIQYLFEGTENKVFAFIGNVINVLNLNERYEILLGGILDIKVIIYFISVILVFLFLTTQVIQKRRFTVSVKNMSMQAFSISMIVIVLAIAVFGNYAISLLPQKYTEFDITSNRLYSLCDVTKETVAEISSPVKIYVYIDEDSKDETVDKILSKYVELNNNISVEYVDPNKSPKFYEKYTDKSPSYKNCLFMEMNDRTKYIDYESMYVSDYVFDDSIGQYTETVSYDIEGQITSGLDYLASGRSPVSIVGITGHDENAISQGYLDAIAKANYEYEELTLLGNEIPTDCKLLFINAPATDFSSDDADKVIAYLENGGQVIITLGIVDNIPEKMPNFNKILSYFEITTSNGLIVDTESFSQSPFFIIPKVSSNIVTEGVYDKKPVWMPYAKPLYTNEESSEVSAVAFLTTTDGAFNKTNLESDIDYNYNEGDPVGPFDVGMTVTKGDSDGSLGRAYVLASPFIFSDEVDEMASNSSVTMFMNIANSCAGGDASSAKVVPTKSMDAEAFIIDNAGGVLIFIVLMLVVPLALLITGFVIWTKRRKK